MKTPITVYLWCNAGVGSTFQFWFAILDDGTIVKSHCSSSRSFGVYDTSPLSEGWTRGAYDNALKASDYDVEFDDVNWTVVVVDAGSIPPQEVLDKNAAKGAAADEEGVDDPA